MSETTILGLVIIICIINRWYNENKRAKIEESIDLKIDYSISLSNLTYLKKDWKCEDGHLYKIEIKRCQYCNSVFKGYASTTLCKECYLKNKKNTYDI